MANAKYFIGASLVAAVVVATPLVISQQIDSKFEENQRIFAENGFKQTLISKSGYLKGTRTFSLEINDAKKARDFILNALVARNVQYKLFAQSLKEESDEGINDALNGLTFNGELVTSQLLPSDAMVSLTLAKLPTSLQDEIANDPKASHVLLPLIDKGVFGVDMTVSSDEKLKSIKLKDIKEHIQIEEGVIDVDTSGNILALNESAGSVHGTLGIQKQNLGIKAPDFMMQSNLENFVYLFDYQDDLNNKGNLSIGKYSFATKDAYSDIQLSTGAMKITSNAEDVKKEWMVKADYSLNNLVFNNQALLETFKLETLIANLSLSGLASESIKKIQADYNALVLNPEGGSEQALMDDFIILVRHGVILDLNIGLKALSGTFALKDITISSTLKIDQNDFSDQQSPLALIGLLDVTSKVKIHKDDRATLEALQITSPEEFARGKADGDYLVYDITFKKGMLSLNGQMLN